MAMRSVFQGGTNLIIDHSGPVVPRNPKRKKWCFFSKEEKMDPRRGQVRFNGCEMETDLEQE